MKVFISDSDETPFIEVKRVLAQREVDIYIHYFPTKQDPTEDDWQAYAFFTNSCLMEKIALKMNWQPSLPWKGYKALVVREPEDWVVSRLEEFFPAAEIKSTYPADEDDYLESA
ncbi:hypothetical protein KKC32_03905 [Patescibacteria group bacterium]|nr:hypothetical protein [Patescibacteria group bacterium]